MTADGSVYVADEAWCFIRRLIPGSTTMEVVAGCDYSVFGNVHAMTVDRSGGLLLADSANGRIRRLDLATKTVTTVVGEFGPTFGGDGGPANLAALNGPMNISRDLRGQIFIGDRYNSRLRRIDAASGIIKTLATGLDPLGRPERSVWWPGRVNRAFRVMAVRRLWRVSIIRTMLPLMLKATFSSAITAMNAFDASTRRRA
jgi:hypothetical protein